MTTIATNHRRPSAAYELFIGGLSLLSLVNLVLAAVLLDPATQMVVYVLDIVLSIVFLLDFGVRLRRTPKRAHYFLREFGWADLLSAVPIPQIKLLRVFQLTRLTRQLRRHTPREIARNILNDRGSSALLTVLFLGVVVLEFGSLAILRVEDRAPDANITTAQDALWYLVVTITTVGYGDRYPVTTAGRVLGVIVLLLGVAIYTTLTGYLANVFLHPRPRHQHGGESPLPEDPVETVARLQELVRQQEIALARLARRLRNPP